MNPEEKKVKKDLLAEKLLQGVEEVFTSQKFKDYLKFYSSFYHYSIRNTILIFLQKPDAQLVAGYESWKKKGRQVRYGEKGIQIFCPVNYYVKLEVTKRDKNGNPVLDENGDPVKEIRKEQAKTFRVGYVYDISQTDGKDPPELASELHGEARNYESIMAGIRHAAAPFSVSFEDVPFAKGYCDFAQQKIVIKQGMSEMQSVKTALHELAHSKLHESREESRETREIEAESVAYMIADHFGLDTSDYLRPESPTEIQYTNYATPQQQSRIDAIVAEIMMEQGRTAPQPSLQEQHAVPVQQAVQEQRHVPAPQPVQEQKSVPIQQPVPEQETQEAQREKAAILHDFDMKMSEIKMMEGFNPQLSEQQTDIVMQLYGTLDREALEESIDLGHFNLRNLDQNFERAGLKGQWEALLPKAQKDQLTPPQKGEPDRA